MEAIRKSYQMLNERGTTNDQFWKEDADMHEEIFTPFRIPAGGPEKVSSLIRPGSALLDIGAGAGAFALPQTPRVKRARGPDPSVHQLRVLEGRALLSWDQELHPHQWFLEVMQIPKCWVSLTSSWTPTACSWRMFVRFEKMLAEF
ncbi:MAG TPA: hypothetical protein PLM24_05185 [Methanothrix sp.]|nr:hypothetical protein [Methanothrix sp.]HPJ84823.1 hypothetical protein [Methanothrix sp.]HPR66512.1 hypothetical protein [Methanothrix sp.]